MNIDYQNSSCIAKYPKWDNKELHCYIESSSKISFFVALMGDSHSDQLLPGLINIKDRKYNVHSFVVSGRVPYYGFQSATKYVDKYYSELRSYGAQLWDQAFFDELRDPNTKVFVLAHFPHWSRKDITDNQNPNSSLSSEQLHLLGAKRTFDLLKKYNKRVIIVKDNPWLPFEPQGCQDRPIVFHKRLCSFDRSVLDNYEERNFYNGILEKVAKDYDNITFVDLSEKLCDSSVCYLKIGNLNLYNDKNHLNINGSIYVAPMIDNAIKKALDK